MSEPEDQPLIVPIKVVERDRLREKYDREHASEKFWFNETYTNPHDVQWISSEHSVAVIFLCLLIFGLVQLGFAIPTLCDQASAWGLVKTFIADCFLLVLAGFVALLLLVSKLLGNGTRQ